MKIKALLCLILSNFQRLSPPSSAQHSLVNGNSLFHIFEKRSAAVEMLAAKLFNISLSPTLSVCCLSLISWSVWFEKQTEAN